MKWFDVYNQYYMTCLETDFNNIDLQIKSLFGQVWLLDLTMQKVCKEKVFLMNFIEQRQWISHLIYFCFSQIKFFHSHSSQCWVFSILYLLLNLETVQIRVTLTLDYLCCLKNMQKYHLKLLKSLQSSLQFSAKILLHLNTYFLVACSYFSPDKIYTFWCQDILGHLECLEYVFLLSLSGWWCDTD